jgi:uncharacterized protein YraI
MIIAGSLRRIAVAVAVASVAAVAPVSAQPVRPNGYSITNVNLRAGPGTYYPALLVVTVRSPIRILGCLGDYTWCDVIFQGNRGWMRSIYLQGWYRGSYYSLRDYAPRLGYPVVSFDIDPYWESNYRDRPFYGDRGRWGRSGGSYGEGWTDRASFYGRLAPYGDWIWLQGQYVWVPEDVGPQWRPYTVGRWVYTDRHGWMWNSREPFGWATYHYGRWGFSRKVGWFWVPGSRWAPAWVSWRQSNDYLAWAPLPPTADEGLGINIRVETVPDYYWQVVPNRDFLDDDLPRRIVRDRDRFNPILRETRPLGNVTVVNNTTIVNNVVNVTYVEEKTRKKVVVHKVERTKDERKAKGGGGKVDGAAIEVFQPAADQAPETVAPPKPKAIEEVAKESKTKGQAEGAASTDELLVPAEIKKTPEAEAKPSAPPPPPPPAEEGTPPTEEEAAPPPPPAPAAEEATPPPSEETAPPPPPPAADQAAPPSPPADGAPPPPPAADQAAPPSPPADGAPPPPPADQAAPPPPPANEAPPPAAEEAVPPPPAPPADESAPKAKKEGKPKFKKDKGEPAVPEETLPPPPPPPGEAAPPPLQDMAPPPPASGEEAPKMKKERKPKFKQDKGEEAMPDAPPPPPPSEEAVPPPPPPSGETPPEADKNGKPKGKKGQGKGQGAPCPEGLLPQEDGTCAPPQ